MIKKYIYKFFIGITGILFFGNQCTNAQTNNTQNDCAIEIGANRISSDGRVTDFGIMNYSDLLSIYNNLRQNCEGEDTNNPTISQSYIQLIYTSIVKNKFLLDITSDSYNITSPILADPIAKKRYEKKIEYYKGSKGLNPEIIKEDFDNLWKFGIYTDAIDKDTCKYEGDITRGLYDKFYNICTMANCIRGKIILKNQNAIQLRGDLESCNAYIDSIMSLELDRVTDLVVDYSAKMTNTNFDTYANKYYGKKLNDLYIVNQKIDGFINGLLKKITEFTHSCMG